MTAPDTDTLIALAREGRIAVVPVEATAWQWRSRLKGGSWDAWEQGRFAQEIPPFAEVEERASFTVPANTPTLTPALLALAEERDRLREALELAAEDFRTIKTLNSHGASDQTYIGWLRSNAEQGERRARRALTGDTP